MVGSNELQDGRDIYRPIIRSYLHTENDADTEVFERGGRSEAK